MTDTIFSIVRVVSPGTPCSHPVGRREVQFLAAYRPCLHSSLTSHDARLSMRGRTHDEAREQANSLCQTFNNCCHLPGIKYIVEEVGEESPERAEAA